ncbi:MAG: luciferase [Halovenus sp.]
MTALSSATLAEVGFDGVALKPTEVDLLRSRELDVDTLTVDYEGAGAVPDPDALATLASERTVRVTTPVRATGYDPLGDDSHVAALPDGVGRILVAGNSAYLTPEESRRAVAPRLAAATRAATEPWVGTEGIERLALAAGGTQYDLLSASTERDARALRAAGFDGELAVYAPTVLSSDPDVILDAVGEYAARRGPVDEQLPAGVATDRTATGDVRETLLDACRRYALGGSPEAVTERIDGLREAGVDWVISYPARGLDPFCDGP